MTFAVFYYTFSFFYLFCLSVCMSLCVCVWAMLPDSNKMMMMMMIGLKVNTAQHRKYEAIN